MLDSRTYVDRAAAEQDARRQQVIARPGVAHARLVPRQGSARRGPRAAARSSWRKRRGRASPSSFSTITSSRPPPRGALPSASSSCSSPSPRSPRTSSTWARDLIIVNGRSVDRIPELAAQWKVDRVVAQSWVAPVGRARDRLVATRLHEFRCSCSIPKRWPARQPAHGRGRSLFGVHGLRARLRARREGRRARCRRRDRCRHCPRDVKPATRTLARIADARVTGPRAQPARASRWRANAPP